MSTNQIGCLSLDKTGISFFRVSECSELKKLFCCKEKGEIINSLSSKCGPNTFMDVRGDCYCLSGSFEAESGDANSSLGCKNPCSSHPCPSDTFCQSWTALEYKCVCKDNLAPRNGNAKLFGCEQKSMNP